MGEARTTPSPPPPPPTRRTGAECKCKWKWKWKWGCILREGDDGRPSGNSEEADICVCYHM